MASGLQRASRTLAVWRADQHSLCDRSAASQNVLSGAHDYYLSSLSIFCARWGMLPRALALIARARAREIEWLEEPEQHIGAITLAARMRDWTRNNYMHSIQ
jgi:hypothetical protein